MAKMIQCPFCGKEVKSGLFTGDAEVLSVGETTVSCCPDCYKKFVSEYQIDNKRFAAKMRNYQKVTGKKKLTDRELVQLLIPYAQESRFYGKPGWEPEKYEVLCGTIKVTADGRFSIMEFANDFLGVEANLDQMYSSAKKGAAHKEIWFTKEDITKIEYFSNREGVFNGMLEKVYSYSVRFNDESQITFRPTVTHAIVAGKGVMVGYREKAESSLREQLEVFRALIGSDAPIVRVKK